MNRLEKTYVDVSNTQPTAIFTDISQRIRFEYYFTLKAMEEMAWQAWRSQQLELYNMYIQSYPDEHREFDEELARNQFDIWLKEQV